VGEVGILPVVLAVRIAVAGWIMWSVFKEDAVYLMLALLILGVGCFGGLLGWYFLLLGPVREFFSYDNLPYRLAVCNVLYLVAGLMVGCALLLPRVSTRLGSDRPQPLVVQKSHLHKKYP
jgi:hypothetical protein